MLYSRSVIGLGFKPKSLTQSLLVTLVTEKKINHPDIHALLRKESISSYNPYTCPNTHFVQ